MQNTEVTVYAFNRFAERVCVSPQGSLPQQHPIKSINKSFNEIIYVEFWVRFPFPFMHPVQDQICINIVCYWLLAGHLFRTYLPPSGQSMLVSF